MAPRTLTPAACAAATTGRKRSIDSAIEQLMLRWLKASLAEPNTTTSSGRVASAASRPFMLGVSTLRRTPCKRAMPAITAAASAICGTHFGLTKLVTSISFIPAACSACTSATLSSVRTGRASFCSPSRGPTSTSVTRWGIMGGLETASDAGQPL
jgi:hypothetical protein